jgi:hypothetical protein
MKIQSYSSLCTINRARELPTAVSSSFVISVLTVPASGAEFAAPSLLKWLAVVIKEKYYCAAQATALAILPNRSRCAKLALSVEISWTHYSHASFGIDPGCRFNIAGGSIIPFLDAEHSYN